jgi:hypothetical protein
VSPTEKREIGTATAVQILIQTILSLTIFKAESKQIMKTAMSQTNHSIMYGGISMFSAKFRLNGNGRRRSEEMRGWRGSEEEVSTSREGHVIFAFVVRL